METHFLNKLWCSEYWSHVTAVYADGVFPVFPQCTATWVVAAKTIDVCVWWEDQNIPQTHPGYVLVKNITSSLYPCAYVPHCCLHQIMSYDDSQLYIPIFDPKVQEKFSHCGTVSSKISSFCMIQLKVVFLCTCCGSGIFLHLQFLCLYVFGNFF